MNTPCRRHTWVRNDSWDGSDGEAPFIVYQCCLCNAVRDEGVRRRNRNNRQRGSKFESTVAKAIGGRRAGPLGGRDDVMVGAAMAVQTKKSLRLSLNEARTYLVDLSRIYPDRTALVIHARPGHNPEPVVILTLATWLDLHGNDGVKDDTT